MVTKRVFLVGAGISVDSPACVPMAIPLTERIIKALSPPGATEELLTLARPWRQEKEHPGDYIRFELLMEVLQEFVDPTLSILSFLEDYRSPNPLHFFLANQCRMGDSVVTTNFDILIEEACLRLGLNPRTVCSLEDFGNWKRMGTGGMLPVFKIHGSIQRVIGQSHRESSLDTLGTTIKTITEGVTQLVLPKNKLRFFADITRGAELIVAGYSGSDDFDIVPSLHQIFPRRITWIEHDANQTTLADITDERRRSLLSKPEAACSAKELFFRHCFVERPGVLRVLSVATKNFLFSEFERIPFDSTDIPADPARLDRFFAKWQSEHLNSEAVRNAACAELFYRLCRFPQAKCFFMEAIKRLEPDVPTEKKAQYLLAIVRTCVDLAQYTEAAEWLGQLKPHLKKLPVGLLARYKQHLGFVTYKLRRLNEAKRLLRDAYTFAQQNRLDFFAGSALHDLGAIHQDLGQHLRALKSFRASILLSSKAGDIRHVSWSKFQVGVIMYFFGQFAKARRFYCDSMQIAERSADLNHMSVCLHDFALLGFLEGKLAFSIRTLRRCLDIAKATGQAEYSGMDWQHIGVALVEKGHLSWAQECFRRADDLYVRAGDEATRSELFSYWAALALARHEYVQALDLALKATRIGEASSMPEYLSRAWVMLGLVRSATGDFQTGRLSIQKGLRIARKIKGVIIELAFYLALYGRKALFTASVRAQLRWAKGAYDRMGNKYRASVIRLALASPE